MAKIRYQLIRPLRPGQNEESAVQIYFKCLLAMTSVLLIVIYASHNWTSEKNYVIPIESTAPSTEATNIQNEVPSTQNLKKKIHSTMGNSER